MKHQTLKVTNQMAWELLGENAGLYGDNGGESDGNAWLPGQPLDGSDEGVDEVIEAGYGEIVYAIYTSVDEICEDINWLAAEINTVAEINGHEQPEYDDVREVLEYGSKRINGREWNWMWSGFLSGSVIVVEAYTLE